MASSGADAEFDDVMNAEENNENASQDSELFEDSEDSNSDVEDNAEEQGKELLELEEKIQFNPVQYDLHTQYISLLRMAGRLQKLREAREKMSSLFPLTPQLWIEWIQDESRLISSAEEILKVESLYERGVQDYLSVDLWCSYLDFVVTHYQQENGKNENGNNENGKKEDHLNRCRLLFEKSLSFCGLHFTEGKKIWQKFLNFELEKSSELEEKEQMDKVRSLYHRQLCIPHADIDKTLSNYHQFEIQAGKVTGKNVSLDECVSFLPKHVQFSFSKAKTMSIEREKMEEKLNSFQSMDEQCLHVYLEYIQIEKQTNEPSRIQYIYERTLSLFPLRSEIWIDYVNYLDHDLKVHSVTKNVYFRALRNCPWVFKLWFQYLLALERSKASQNEIQMAFEQSLLSGLQNPDEYVELFLLYMDGLRRRYEFGDDMDEKEKTDIMNQLHSVFERSKEMYETYFSEYFDSFFKIFCLFAQLEARIFKNYEMAKTIWQELTKNHGNKFIVWKKYIDFELSQNNTSNVRSIYKLCFSKKFEDYESQEMCNDWIRFERERGRLEDYDYAMSKASKRLEEIDQFLQKSFLKNLQNQNQDYQNKEETESQPFKQSTKRQNKSDADKDKKRKRDFSKSKANKKIKNQTLAPEKEGEKEREGEEEGVDGDREEGDERMDVRGNDGVESIGKGREEGRKEKAEESKEEEERKKEEEKTHVVYSDDCTAFVSSLPFNVTKEELEEFFSSCGNIKDIRMVMDRNTKKFKGVAYVEFGNEDSLNLALEKNKTRIHGRPVSILKSDPHKGFLFKQQRFQKEKDAEEKGKKGGKDKGEEKKKGATITFAKPRAVSRPSQLATKPIGSVKKKTYDQTSASVSDGGSQDDAPVASNQTFRQMFFKK